jgi:CRP-like cAMP-binding protein
VSRERKAVLSKRNRTSFDPKAFLAKVGEGKAISKYRKDQIIFSQGAVADAVFYIQKGKIKLTVISERARKLSSVSSGLVTLLAKAVSMVIRCESQQLPR